MGAVLGLSFVLALLGTVACAFARGRGASWIALLASGVFGVAGAALFAWSRAPWRAALASVGPAQAAVAAAFARGCGVAFGTVLALSVLVCLFVRQRWLQLAATALTAVVQAAFLPLASLVALSVSPKLEASPLGGLVTAQALSLLLLLYWAHFFSALLRLLRGR